MGYVSALPLTVVLDSIRQCLDGNNLLATFQIAPPSVNYFARVIVQRAAMPIITEIMTSLELNRMALALPWDL